MDQGGSQTPSASSKGILCPSLQISYGSKALPTGTAPHASTSQSPGGHPSPASRTATSFSSKHWPLSPIKSETISFHLHQGAILFVLYSKASHVGLVVKGKTHLFFISYKSLSSKVLIALGVFLRRRPTDLSQLSLQNLLSLLASPEAFAASLSPSHSSSQPQVLHLWWVSVALGFSEICSIL